MHTIDQLFPDISLSYPQLQRLAKLFRRFCRDLDGALERAEEEFSSHNKSKGDICEAAVRTYLQKTLGTRYGVAGNGQIFDILGSQSKEIDVIIFDNLWSTRFTPADSKEPPIIPVESVYAVIEVKKRLTARDLRNAVGNLASFKQLVRERVGPDYVAPNKRIQNLGAYAQNDVRNPYFAGVFAFQAGRKMETIFEQLLDEVKDLPTDLWPDVVVVHNEGVILPYCATCQGSQGTIYGIADDGHEPTYTLDILGQSYSLLGFHLLLAQHLHKTILAPPKYHGLYGQLAEISRMIRAWDVTPVPEDEEE